MWGAHGQLGVPQDPQLLLRGAALQPVGTTQCRTPRSSLLNFVRFLSFLRPVSVRQPPLGPCVRVRWQSRSYNGAAELLQRETGSVLPWADLGGRQLTSGLKALGVSYEAGDSVTYKSFCVVIVKHALTESAR